MRTDQISTLLRPYNFHRHRKSPMHCITKMLPPTIPPLGSRTVAEQIVSVLREAWCILQGKCLCQ